MVEGLGDGPISDCHEIDGELVVVVEQGEQERLIPLSPDGTMGAPLPLPDDARIREINDVDGQRVATGWAPVNDVDTAALWWETDSGWERWPPEEAGLGTDDFGASSQAVEVFVTDEEVVLVVSDEVGPVVWTADRSELVARLTSAG